VRKVNITSHTAEEDDAFSPPESVGPAIYSDKGLRMRCYVTSGHVEGVREGEDRALSTDALFHTPRQL
jgi:hypothetical protein